MTEVDAEILARDDERGRFLEAASEAYPEVGKGPGHGVQLANWIIHELPRVRGARALEDLPFGPSELAGLVALVVAGVISSSAAAEVLGVMAREGGEPAEIVRRLDLAQVSDRESLEPVIAEVLAANPGKVRAFRSGRDGLLGYFMGQVMARTGGKADPAFAMKALRARLGGDDEKEVDGD